MIGLGIKSLGIFQLPPTITGIDRDFASAGGGESRTVTGTNLFNAGITVDGYAATITGNTATTVTFTTPASGVDTTNGNATVSVVKVATPGGSASTAGTALNSLWYLPTYLSLAKAGVWSAQNVTLSGSNIATVIDQTGNGYTLLPSQSPPAYHSSGGGSSGKLPYWQNTFTNATTANGLKATGYPSITGSVGEWVIGCKPGTSSTNNSWFASLSAASGTNDGGLLINSAGTTLSTYNGAPNNVNAVSFTVNTNILVSSYVAASGSATSRNTLNGTATSGACGTNSSTGGVYIGSDSSGNAGVNALYYFVFRYPAALSSTGESNFLAYAINSGI